MASRCSNVRGLQDALLRQLRSLDNEVEVVPKGWRTIKQWAAKWGYGLTYTRQLLRRGVEAGIMEVKSYRVMSGPRPSPVPHYRKKR